MERSHLSSSYGLLIFVLAVVSFLSFSGCARQKGPQVVVNKFVIINNSSAIKLQYEAKSETQIDGEFLQEMKDLLDLDLKVTPK